MSIPVNPSAIDRSETADIPPGDGQTERSVHHDSGATPSVRQDEIRACAVTDLPAIARLFQNVFRNTDAPAPQDLIDHLRKVYFEHPWATPETPSLAFVSADGTVDGFVGVLPLRLRFAGRKVTGAIAGSLMVRAPQQRPLAGVRLLRSFLAGKQEFSTGDTANWISQGLWERMGGSPLPLASMEWLKIIHPFRFGATLVANRIGRWAGYVLSPIAAGGDAIANLVSRKAPTPSASPFTDQTVDAEAFIGPYLVVSGKQAVSLDLDRETLRWFLAQAAEKRRHGDLVHRVVSDRAGRPVGCYLIYCRKGAAAEVLQIVTEPRHADAVMASVVAFARSQGCSAVRGRTQAGLMTALFKIGCLMRHRCSTVVNTADAAMMQALEGGTSMLGGFFGETWMRLVSDEFGSHAQPGRAANPVPLSVQKVS